MAKPLDLVLIDDYTRSINVPVASQAGYAVRADSAGTNIEYIGPQVSEGSVVWDGKAPVILVRGSGARTVTLKNGYFLGQTVEVVDVLANAGAGTITIAFSEGSATGTFTISSSAVASRRYLYTESGHWREV